MIETGSSSDGNQASSDGNQTSLDDARRNDGVPLPDNARRAALDRVVKEHVREDRAKLVSRSDFEAHLVRGKPVSHELHLGIFAAIVVATIVAFAANLGPALQAVSAALFVGYGCLWAFFAFTGGPEFDTLAVDEAGKVTITREGRPVEYRGDVLRVGVPILVMLASVYLVFSLGRDIAYPPPPHCNPIPSMGPDYCSMTPQVDPNAPPTGSIRKETVMFLERGLRILQFTAFAVIGTAAALFEWAMLSGRGVLILSAPVFVMRRKQAGTPRKTG